jgi:hypothetical protein
VLRPAHEPVEAPWQTMVISFGRFSSLELRLGDVDGVREGTRRVTCALPKPSRRSLISSEVTSLDFGTEGSCATESYSPETRGSSRSAPCGLVATHFGSCLTLIRSETRPDAGRGRKDGPSGNVGHAGNRYRAATSRGRLHSELRPLILHELRHDTRMRCERVRWVAGCITRSTATASSGGKSLGHPELCHQSAGQHCCGIFFALFHDLDETVPDAAVDGVRTAHPAREIRGKRLSECDQAFLLRRACLPDSTESSLEEFSNWNIRVFSLGAGDNRRWDSGEGFLSHDALLATLGLCPIQLLKVWSLQIGTAIARFTWLPASDARPFAATSVPKASSATLSRT